MMCILIVNTKNNENSRNYAIVQFLGGKSVKYYRGLNLPKDNFEDTIRFSQKSTGKNKFKFPTVEDISVIEINVVIYIKHTYLFKYVCFLALFLNKYFYCLIIRKKYVPTTPKNYSVMTPFKFLKCLFH